MLPRGTAPCLSSILPAPLSVIPPPSISVQYEGHLRRRRESSPAPVAACYNNYDCPLLQQQLRLSPVTPCYTRACYNNYDCPLLHPVTASRRAGLAFCVPSSRLCTVSGGVCYTGPRLEVACSVQGSYGVVLSAQGVQRGWIGCDGLAGRSSRGGVSCRLLHRRNLHGEFRRRPHLSHTTR